MQEENSTSRTPNTEHRTFFARLKTKLKEYKFIYYPVHYTLVMFRSFKSFMRWQLYKYTLTFNRSGLNTTEQRPRKIIASLTSYPARIDIVHYTIASLLKQTMKPDKIILWLAESQFPDKKLPKIFKKLQACGVEIKFCPENIGSHTKYYYTVKEYPEDIVITFDDDIVYRKHVIETLYRSYLDHPECVSSMRVHKITFRPDGSISPYTDWKLEYSGVLWEGSHIWLATGVGGRLYPPHCLPTETFNKEALKNLCLRADDVWLKFMEVMNGTKVVPAYHTSSIQGFEIPDSQESALWKSNLSSGGNDTQIHAMLEAYSDWRDPSGRTLLDVIRDD